MTVHSTRKHGPAPVKVLVIIALVVGGVIIWRQSTTISALRVQADIVPVQKQDIDRLQGEIKNLERLRVENQELALLREKFSNLEKRNHELEKLLMDQEATVAAAAVATAARRGTNALPPLQPTEALIGNYFARESWSDSGFGTPADAIETMFWALREANFERLVETMSEDDAKGFTGGFKTDADIELFWRATRRSPIGRLPGYYIVDVENVGDDHTIVYLNTIAGETAGLEPSAIGLTRVKDEWKLHDGNY
jgi:hypothetical protein